MVQGSGRDVEVCTRYLDQYSWHRGEGASLPVMMMKKEEWHARETASSYLGAARPHQ